MLNEWTHIEAWNKEEEGYQRARSLAGPSADIRNIQAQNKIIFDFLVSIAQEIHKKANWDESL